MLANGNIGKLSPLRFKLCHCHMIPIGIGKMAKFIRSPTSSRSVIWQRRRHGNLSSPVRHLDRSLAVWQSDKFNRVCHRHDVYMEVVEMANSYLKILLNSFLFQDGIDTRWYAYCCAAKQKRNRQIVDNVPSIFYIK